MCVLLLLSWSHKAKRNFCMNFNRFVLHSTLKRWRCANLQAFFNYTWIVNRVQIISCIVFFFFLFIIRKSHTLRQFIIIWSSFFGSIRIIFHDISYFFSFRRKLVLIQCLKVENTSHLEWIKGREKKIELLLMVKSGKLLILYSFFSFFLRAKYKKKNDLFCCLIIIIL